MLKSFTRRFTDLLEYLLVFVVIVECNSMFTMTKLADKTTDMTVLLQRAAMVLLAATVVLHLLSGRKSLGRLKGYAPLWLLMVGYAVLFRQLDSRAGNSQDYFLKFLVFLPLLALLFRLKYQEGEGLDLLYKHSDVTCAIAALSLLVYLSSVFHVDDMPSDAIYSTWTQLGHIQERINLLNVCQFAPAQRWQMSVLELLRNYGFYVEPLMFALPLTTALYTELFLRKKTDRGHIAKAVLLTVTLVSVNATLCLMLMAVAWGLKVVSTGVERRNKLLVGAVLCVMIGLCVVLFLEKKSLSFGTTAVSGSSIADHIEDYRASIKAFLNKPLLGGGYRNSNYVRLFMSADKAARNPGLSNSAGVVLAQGGLVLGVLCLLPFGLALCYIFRRRDRRLALWAVGTLSLFVGVIFIYRLFLVFLMAFGYALPEVRRVEGKRFPYRLALADFGLNEAEEPAPEAVRRQRLRMLWIVGIAVLAGALLVGFGLPVWNLIYRFLRTHQFSMSQSPLKAFCLGAALVFHLACARAALRGELDRRRLLALIAWDGIYLLLYPKLYSDAVTLLQAKGLTEQLYECAAMLCAYFAGGALVLNARPKGWLRLRRALLVYGAIAAVAAVFILAQVKINRMAAASGETLAPLLKALTRTASGTVYSNAQPSVAHRLDSAVHYTSTGKTGYDALQNATVVYTRGTDRPELFEKGFEVAELMDDYLVYTNDERLISALTDQGAVFYRYYAFDKEVDLANLAKKNGLKRTKKGSLILTSAKKSLRKGPGSTLRKGQYTLEYRMRLDLKKFENASPDTVVCSLQVTCFGGDTAVAQMDVTLDQFDEKGDATVYLPFTLKEVSNSVSYKLLSQGTYKLYLKSLKLRQTPDYITVATYNSHRELIRSVYYGTDGEPYVSANGYAALERDFNLGGMVTAIRYYGADGKPVVAKNGYAEIRYGYNGKRLKNYEAYFDVDGQPMMISKGYASVRTAYDAYGNPVRVSYYGLNGEPVLSIDGYAEVRRVYNEKKQKIEETYYDVDGAPMLQPKGYTGIRQVFNDHGEVSVRTFIQDGETVLRTDGYAEVHWERDGLGRVIREEFYNAEGKPVKITGGYAADEREYDSAGNVAVYRYFGSDGKPILLKSGYAEVHRLYNQKKQIIREDYYGPDGNLIPLLPGYCTLENEYDELGNVSMRRFLGTDGQPIIRRDGYTEVHWQYDVKHRIIREEYYGTDGMLIRINDGSAGNEREYDSAGNIKTYRYFDTDGKPVTITAGYAEVHRLFNEKRQVTREEYYGIDGMPMVQPEGHCALEMEYDDMGNVSVKRFYDDRNQPIAICDGYAEIRRVYDRKQVIREAYFDTEGKPFVRAAGYVAIEQAYDSDGKLSVRRYLDAQGNLTERNDGYAEARWTYDADSVRTVSFYDLNGREVPAEGLNLVLDAPDGWSKWFTPRSNTPAIAFTIGNMNLGKRIAGDEYTCRIEIEFSNVSATEGKDFLFRTEGSTDGAWEGKNIWNSQLVKLTETPEDGVYAYSVKQSIGEKAIDADVFNVSFRCDYWASGSFRVRCVKVEKGADPSDWTPGL